MIISTTCFESVDMQIYNIHRKENANMNEKKRENIRERYDRTPSLREDSPSAQLVNPDVAVRS